jgi:hypothetical protein
VEYYIVAGSQRKGPFSLNQLRSEAIDLATLMWHKGMTNWRPAAELPEIVELLQSIPPPLPTQVAPKKVMVVAQSMTPNNPSPSAAPTVSHASPSSKRRGAKPNKLETIVGIVLCIGVVMTLSFADDAVVKATGLSFGAIYLVCIVAIGLFRKVSGK